MKYAKLVWRIVTSNVMGRFIGVVLMVGMAIQVHHQQIDKATLTAVLACIVFVLSKESK